MIILKGCGSGGWGSVPVTMQPFAGDIYDPKKKVKNLAEPTARWAGILPTSSKTPAQWGGGGEALGPEVKEEGHVPEPGHVAVC